MKPSRLLSLVFLSCLLFLSFSDLQAQGAKNFIPSRNVTFQSTSVGKTSIKTVIIYNIDSTFTLGVTLSHPQTANYTLLSPDTFNIRPMSVDTVRIQFNPTTTGKLIDSLWITHDGDTSGFSMKNPTKLKFTGTAIAANDTSARISILSNGVINFGRVSTDTFATARLAIRNISDTIRTLYGTIHGVYGAFSLLSDSNFSIAQGDTGFFTFKFAPTTAISYGDTLHITSNADSANRNIRILLGGVGLAVVAPADTAKFTLSTSIIDFGTLKVDSSSSDALIIITNTTSTPTQLTATVTPPAAPFKLTGPPGQLRILQGVSDTLHVTFTPLVAGAYQDSVVIRTNSTQEFRRVVIPINGFAIQVIEGVNPGATAVHLNVTAVPNPVAETLAITLTSDASIGAKLALYDVSGQLVGGIFDGRISGKTTLDYSVQSLPAGSYFLRMDAGNESRTMKLVIQH